MAHRRSFAFVITRTTKFRHLGSVIEAAMEHGHDVTLWLDHGQPADGPKGYQFPSADRIPQFVGGQPGLVAFSGATGLSGLVEAASPDVIVASRGPSEFFGGVRPPKLPFWATVQEQLDFVGSTLAALASSDLVCLYSLFWLDLVERVNSGQEDAQFIDELRQKVACVGSTHADGCHLVDAAEVRRRWGVRSDVPVVVYVPSNSASDVFFRVLFARNALTRAAYIAHARRWGLMRHALQPLSDRAMVSAVRQFCDRNGAFLVAKVREKNPLPGYLEKAADLLVSDGTEYPPGVFEPLAVASLCISAYLSNVALDAATAGVPFFAFARNARDWPATWDGERFVGVLDEAFYHIRTGGPFNHQGATYAMPIVEGVRKLPSMALEDFPLVAEARARYVERFLGQADGSSGQRALEAILERLDA